MTINLNSSSIDWNVSDVSTRAASDTGQYELLPAGTIVKVRTDIKEGHHCKGFVTQSKNSDSCYINFKLVVQEGKYSNRTLFHMVGVRGKNLVEGKEDVFAEMGKRSIVSMLASAYPNQTFELNNYSQLNGLVCYAMLDIKKAEGDYPAKNVVKAFVPAPKVESAESSEDIPF